MEIFDGTLSGLESLVTCYCSCPNCTCYDDTPHATPATAVMVSVNHYLGT